MIAVAVALILGPFIFYSQKGTNLHKHIGKMWGVAMVVLNVSALLTYELGGRPNLFHAFAVLSLVTLGMGWWSIYRFRKLGSQKYLSYHYQYMGSAFFGLVAAGVWQVVITLGRLGVINIPYSILFNGLGVLTAISAVGLFVWYLRKDNDLRTQNH